MVYEEFFDPERPGITEIRNSYKGRFIDLNDYDGLKDEDVVYAVMEAGNKGRGLIIPEVYCFWDRDSEVGIKGNRVRLDSALRFKKYGPEINLTTSGTSIREIKERGITPRKLFREMLGDSVVRERLLNGSYRGIGYWDPRKRTHRIIPFDVPVEGQKFLDFHGKEMGISYQYADCYITVPSLSRGDREYIITIRVLPVTELDEEYLVEWFMTESPCGCEDSFFKTIRGKEDDLLKTLFKYSNPEYSHCRHFWGALQAAYDRSKKDPKAKPFLVEFPRATGLVNPWYTLKTRTVIGNENRARRPLKTEIGIMCGKIIGYCGPEEMFDLEEDINI